MRVSAISVLIMACIVSGCGQEGTMTSPGPKSPGRYSGIGTYDAGRLWQEKADAAAPSDPATARLEDDEHVIVVIDSHTGEVRQCGDHSGFCVTMNPWAAQGQRSAAPAKLKKHASDLEAEDQASMESEPTANEAAPAR